MALTPTNDGLKQQSLRTKLGKINTDPGTFNEDFHAYWDFLAISAGPFEARMLLWINAALAANYTNVNAAQQAYATAKGANNWSSLGDLVLP